MKHLIIYAHPFEKSLNARLKTKLVDDLQQGNHEVQVRDLYRLGFDPILSSADLSGQRKGLVAEEVKHEQNFIQWADCITLIHPIWWTGLPAIVKGYIDRVFSYGFAYRYDKGVQKGLLKGKQIVIINTQGKSVSEYAATGMDIALTRTSDEGIYRYCGLEIKKHFFFDSAERTTPETLAQWQGQIESVYRAMSVRKKMLKR